MAIQISDTTTKKGLVQFYEKEIGLEYGDVSGNSDKLAEFIARVGVTLDNYLLLWAKNAGTWQGDDMNFTDFQIITTDITSGRRDYSFTSDQNSHRITDVSKVLILPSATSTIYREIFPTDELNTDENDILTIAIAGIPITYGKIGTSVLLDPVPNYNASDGIKMVVNREGSYPTTSDTTKVIGVPAFHEYFYLKPAYEYACIHGSSNLTNLEKKVADLEGNERMGITGKIADFFSGRERDIRKVMTGKKINYI